MFFGLFAKLLHGTRSVPTTEAPPPPPRQQQHLPFDVLLEIAARVDPATVLCFAATCKPLRRGILDPSFRRHRLTVLGGGSDDDFDPALLLGFSYRLRHERSWIHDSAHVVRTAASARPRLRIRPRPLEAFWPVASRDGLVVLLRRDYDYARFHVWDALTGRATCLPSMEVEPEEYHYPLAVLNVAGDRSFEVLVAVWPSMRFKIFSSKKGRWGVQRAVPVPPLLCYQPTTQPAIVGHTVHWLCPAGTAYHVYVHALDLDAAVATTMKLPPGCSRLVRFYERDTGVLLASVGGRLSLLVAESVAISMWTLTSELSAPSWSRQVVLSVSEIERRAGLLQFDTTTRPMSFPVRLEAFGERSGAVILKMWSGELVRLDLGTKEVTTLGKYGGNGKELSPHVCLHEMNLASLLQAMKSF